jgi:hypothetical protein
MCVSRMYGTSRPYSARERPLDRSAASFTVARYVLSSTWRTAGSPSAWQRTNASLHCQSEKSIVTAAIR